MTNYQSQQVELIQGIIYTIDETQELEKQLELSK